jgi:hypothetical protein
MVYYMVLMGDNFNFPLNLNGIDSKFDFLRSASGLFPIIRPRPEKPEKVGFVPPSSFAPVR